MVLTEKRICASCQKCAPVDDSPAQNSTVLGREAAALRKTAPLHSIEYASVARSTMPGHEITAFTSARR